MRWTRLTYLVATAGAWLSICSPANAGVDPTFGAGGTAKVDLGPAYGSVAFEHVEAAPDGGAFTEYRPFGPGQVRHYRADGSLDTAYTRPGPAYPARTVPLGDGRKLIVELTDGNEPGAAKVRRVLEDGSPDPSWTTTFLSVSPQALGIGPAGKLLFAESSSYYGPGGSHGTSLSIGRLSVNGGLDPAFGGGNSGVNFSEGLTLAGGVTERATEGVVIAAQDGEGRALLGLKPDGTRDPGFGTSNGLLPISVRPLDLKPLADGRFLLAGTSPVDPKKHPHSDDNLVAARFLPNGAADQSFGDGGRVIVDFGGIERATAMLMRDDGSVVLGGTTMPRTHNCSAFRLCREQPVLAILTSTGTLDTSFGEDGKMALSGLESEGVGSETSVSSIAARAGGGVLAGGAAVGRSFLAATTPGGQLDQGFAGGIVTETSNAPSDGIAAAIGVDPAGRILLGAFTDAGTTPFPRARLLRFGRNGSLDAGFGGPAGVRLPAGVTKLAVDGKGRALVVGGETGLDPRTVTRVTPGGALDSTYADEGTASPIPGRNPSFAAIATTPKGAALLVGGIAKTRNPTVFRLRPDGSLDRRFGKGGVSTLPIGRKGGCVATSEALAGGGRLYVGGYCQGPKRIFVARTRDDGRLDRSFGRRGVALLGGVGGPAEATAVARQGKSVVVAGRVGPSADPKRVVLARLDRRGRLDRGFGMNGIADAGAFGKKPQYCANGVEATSIAVSRQRIVLVRDGSGNPVTRFGRNGVRLGSGGDNSITPGRLPYPGCFPGPVAASQGTKPVLAWTVVDPPTARTVLTRLDG
jgi:uncharacterized delta-60 repeat protein